jgi:hypothetical protein
MMSADGFDRTLNASPRSLPSGRRSMRYSRPDRLYRFLALYLVKMSSMIFFATDFCDAKNRK